jgi:hypothetical protein
MTDTKSSSQNEPEMKGWLFKWTNYLKGYQRRWFVLQNGTLSYYRSVCKIFVLRFLSNYVDRPTLHQSLGSDSRGVRHRRLGPISVVLP